MFYRASVDGGLSLSPTARASSYVPGYRYISPQGCMFPYGDLFQMAITPDGLTHFAFGETSAYVNPGNIWVVSATR